MDNMNKKVYGKFLITMAISFVTMYFVMFLNMARIDHYHTSLTRLYMTLLMIAPMAVVMIVMMPNMYPDKKINRGIIAASVVVFCVTLAALRTQTPIGDVQYMKAMIPHHSSAILTSTRADIKDPEVKQLADSIIAAQEREIQQMEQILKRLK